MTITRKQCKVNNILITLETTKNGIYHVTACENHDGNLYGYPLDENYTCRLCTANSYYYYLRRKYK